MAVPNSKTELLAAIAKTYEKLAEELTLVSPDRAREMSMDGHARGTLMSPSDLVAYLVGWNELVLKWLERDDTGRAIDFPETGYKWNQLGLLAQKFYADRSDRGWPELLAQLESAKSRLITTIAARSDDELYGAPWYNQWTKGRMIQFNTSSPYANARNRLRSWRKG